METLRESNLVDIPSEGEDERVELDQWLELFAIMVHDLESPLASQKYLLKMLTSGKFDSNNSAHQVLIKSCQIAITRAESILYDIMAVAKAGKVGIPLDIKQLELKSLVEDAISLASGSAGEHGVKISCEKELHNLSVDADPKLLMRLMDNLLFNAIRHTPDGGTISVYTTEEKKSVYVHVKDDGDGLGDIDPSTLFEKYGQLRLRANRKHRGVGLGLYFCKLVATGMGGTILADDHPNGGAVFSIRLLKDKG